MQAKELSLRVPQQLEVLTDKLNWLGQNWASGTFYGKKTRQHQNRGQEEAAW